MGGGGGGGKKTFKRYLKSKHMDTWTDKHTDISTYESIGPEGWCFEKKFQCNRFSLEEFGPNISFQSHGVLQKKGNTTFLAQKKKSEIFSEKKEKRFNFKILFFIIHSEFYYFGHIWHQEAFVEEKIFFFIVKHIL